MAGGLTGLAVVLNAVRFNQIPSNAGLGLKMKVIAAVVVGGTALPAAAARSPVRSSVVVLLGAIGPALTFIGITAYWERAIHGVIILAAVGVDASRDRPWRLMVVAAAWHRASIVTTRDAALAPATSILFVVVAAEAALFAGIAPNFATVGNFFEIARISVELGLLAIALTPVIISWRHRLVGRSDDGVGRGRLWIGIPRLGAASIRSRTLRRRGRRRWRVAERGPRREARDPAAHRHTRNLLALSRHRRGHYAGSRELQRLPGRIFLGQGYLWGFIPAQLPVFALVFAAYAVLLHRSVIGRALYGIGFGQAGARYAGIPVARRVGLV